MKSASLPGLTGATTAGLGGKNDETGRVDCADRGLGDGDTVDRFGDGDIVVGLKDSGDSGDSLGALGVG